MGLWAGHMFYILVTLLLYMPYNSKQAVINSNCILECFIVKVVYFILFLFINENNW